MGGGAGHTERLKEGACIEAFLRGKETHVTAAMTTPSTPITLAKMTNRPAARVNRRR